ncbi:MAG: G1 family endopeptidase [Chloroflexota bacterium]|nr:G1 family endopeptidase [Chloroflexota bacterium]
MKRFAVGLVVLAILIMHVGGVNVGLDALFPLDVISTVTSASGGPPKSVVEGADQTANTAIQQVIQRSNEEQVQAVAARDSSVMADTLTSDHYQELVQINQDLLNSGVASIELVKLEWGAVAVDGSTATATTYETWTTTLSDGTTDQVRSRNDYSLVLENGAWKIKSDTHPDQAGVPGQPGPITTTPPPDLPLPGLPDNQNTSHNWSGYAAAGGGTYTSVSGTWSVPQFAPDGPFGIDAAWVGIGGVRSHDLIQAGTQETVSGSGSTQYEAWVETLPHSSRPVPLRVHAGDSVTVAISEESPDQWLIQFTNHTTGQTYQTTEQYASSHSSAEWIEEAPSSGRGNLLPLDNFGTIPFSSGSAVKDGQTLTIAGANARAITMIGDTNQALAVPSGLSDDGTSFSVARTTAPATAAGRPGGGRPRRVPPPGN